MKRFSRSMTTKTIAFVLLIICFAGMVRTFFDLTMIVNNDRDIGIVFEDDYFLSKSYIAKSNDLVNDISILIGNFKSEEHILKGGTIDEFELMDEEHMLYMEIIESEHFNDHFNETTNFETSNSESAYTQPLNEEMDFKKFEREYADEIDKIKQRLINRDLRHYNLLLQKIKEVKEPLYYASDGDNIYTNGTMKNEEQFKNYPSYMILERNDIEIYPKKVEINQYLGYITSSIHELEADDRIYIAFSNEFLNASEKEWLEDKEAASKSFYTFITLAVVFLVLFFYLLLVSGRKPEDEEVHLHAIDKLYVDLNIIFCVGLVFSIGLIMSWGVLLNEAYLTSNLKMIISVVTLIFSVLSILLFSMIRHIKNKTFFKHALISRIIKKIADFIKHVYDSGNVGVKTVLIVIGYPLLIAVTFFMFPVTIAIAAWFALKKIQSFNKIKDGVEKIKNGDLHYSIDIGGDGEFAKLATNINSIAGGLKNAVDNELKNERLKTELITNVSHDIRTPLTSIITYVDLLKEEKDPTKIETYVEVLDQKSKRLKILTDDLFEAAKATSGNIPARLERIDIVSLIAQGMGEVNDKIEALDLEFIFNHPQNKIYITADGNLLWRAIENVLSNIFKYTLRGSRVYIDVEDLGGEVRLTFKNVSAYALNISADELMERFKRGDESRSSQGSGLGLSIAKSLIEVQKGKFIIQIDGDLFKSMIYMPKLDE